MSAKLVLAQIAAAVFIGTPAVACTLSISGSLPNGTVGQPYSAAFSATADCFGSIAWSASLPAGLSIDPSTGVVSGMPTQAGGFPVASVTATETLIGISTGTLTATLSFNEVTIAPAPAPCQLQINGGPQLPAGVVGVPYSLGLSYSSSGSCVAPIVWSGGGVPGLSIDSTGVISGVPTQAGSSFSFSATVRDQSGGFASANFGITITGGSVGPFITCTLGITSSGTLPSAVLNQSYSDQLSYSESLCIAPFTFTATTSLPPGLGLSSSGLISGTPTQTGMFSFSAKVQASDGSSVPQPFSIQVLAEPAQPCQLNILTGSPLSSGIDGVYYSNGLNFAQTNCVLPIAWSAATPAPGLTLNPQGLISGTPTSLGTFLFTAVVQDSASHQASQQYAITVCPSPPGLTVSPTAITASVQDIATPKLVGVLSLSACDPTVHGFKILETPPWIQMSQNSGPLPAVLTVTADLSKLDPDASPFKGNIVAAAGAFAPVPVPVTVTLGNAPPNPVLLPPTLTFISSASNAQPLSGSIEIVNTGGGTLPYSGSPTVNNAAATPWLTISSADLATPGLIGIMVNPAGLAPFTYHGTISIPTVPKLTADVYLQVTAGSSTGCLDTDFNHLTFFAAPGQTNVPSQTITVFDDVTCGAPGPIPGSDLTSTLNWTATLIDQVPWLSFAPSGGTSTPTNPGTLTFTVNATGIGPGVYDARVELTAPNVSAYSIIITLVVPAADSAPITVLGAKTPDDKSSFTLYTAPDTAPPQTGTLPVNTTSPDCLGLIVSATTEDGNPWLQIVSYPPCVSNGLPGNIVYTINPAGLAAGTYTGCINVQVGMQPAQCEVITLVVTNPNQVCTPSYLVITPGGLANNGEVSVSQTVVLWVTVTDNCGNPVTDANVSATISGGLGQPPQFTPPRPASTEAQYTSQWMTGNQGAVFVNLIAAEITGAGNPIFGTITLLVNIGAPTDPNPPTLGGIVNAASLKSAPLVPGSGVTAYGMNLYGKAQGDVPACATEPAPVPGMISGGGIQSLQIGLSPMPPLPQLKLPAIPAAPLFYDGPSTLASGCWPFAAMAPTAPFPVTPVSVANNPDQITAQVPFETASYPLVEVWVKTVDGRYGILPTLVPTQTVDPALFPAPGDSTHAYVQHADGSQVTSCSTSSNARPAKPGEVLTAFANALGPVLPPIETGYSPSTSPSAVGLRLPQFGVSMSVGGQTAPLQQTPMLAPALVGVYQLSFMVPTGLADGDYPIQVVVTGAGPVPIPSDPGILIGVLSGAACPMQ